MLNPKARRFLLIQQELRIARRQAAQEHLSKRRADQRDLLTLAAALERDFGADPYFDARGAAQL